MAFVVQYYSKKTHFRFIKRLPHFKKAHINTFPAVHLKKLDWLDVSVKFSSELLVVILALVVTVLNIFFFSGHKTFADDSHAAKLLSYHPSLDSKFYGKLTSINTVVVADSGFFARAQADDFVGLSANSVSANIGTTPTDASGSGLISNGVINTQSLSAKDMVAKQIKIYVTQPGDTLRTIADANGISPQTISWANNLSSPTIKAGWNLIILPTDGILYKANSNDTLPDVAKKFHGDLDTIIAYNGLANAEDIQDGQLIIIPGGTITPPPAPTPKPTPKNKKSTNGKVGGASPVQAITPEIDTGNDHIFPKGYCTWYVAQKVHVPWGGNAKAWLGNAREMGLLVNSTPGVGSIVVTNDSARYGHVAIVEQVTDNSIVVSEMNYEHFGRVDTREIPLNSSSIRGYIHE